MTLRTRKKFLFVPLVVLTFIEGGTANAISPDDPLWNVVGPVRPLTEPNNVYMKSVEITYPTAGTGLPMIFHVYDPSGGGLNFNISSKTTTGAVDSSSTFTNVHVSPIAREASGKWGQGSGRFFSDGAGQATYNTPFVNPGLVPRSVRLHRCERQPGLGVQRDDVRGQPVEARLGGSFGRGQPQRARQDRGRYGVERLLQGRRLPRCPDVGLCVRRQHQGRRPIALSAHVRSGALQLPDRKADQR